MDVPLTDRGRRQALEATAVLVRAGVRRPVRLFSSDQARAAETAGIIAAQLGVDTVYSPLLREQALGRLEGRLSRDLTPQPVPDGADISEIAWGGGETIQQAWRRVAAFADTHLRTGEQGDVIVVSHGTLLQVFASYLSGRSHRAVDWTLSVPNGGVILRTVPASAPSEH